MVLFHSDLHISERQMEVFLSDYDEVPYKMLQFMVAHINYGGRVTDALDQRTISVLLQVWLPRFSFWFVPPFVWC
jgi:hypothetical protein